MAEFAEPGQYSFDPLIWRKSAQLAEAFIESDDLLIRFDNQKMVCFGHALDYIPDAL
jgi:hypothetical protein